jgi:hypothetical protein
VKAIVLDKIASVTANCALSREVKLTSELSSKEGDVVAVRVLTRKTTYDQLELTTGRFSNVKPGDVVAGALGHRRALLGYAGHVPESLAPGDHVQLLNLGGVLGICDSVNPGVGQPFDCEVLGQVLTFPYLGERVGVPANIAQNAPPLEEHLDVGDVPVIAVVGTCMNAGKTFACTSLIQEMTHARMKVFAAKCTGVSLRRDVLSMEDAGAQASAIFTDYGVVTTTAKNAPALTRTMLNALASHRNGAPDVIVLELGDGIFGDYGVDAILADATIRASFRAIILAANDPVGAWGAQRALAETYGLDVSVVTGPVTDNVAGTEFVARRMAVPAANARTSSKDLARHVFAAAGFSAREAIHA